MRNSLLPQTILTPKLRRLTKAADQYLYALAMLWTDKSSGHAAVMGRGIRRGMIYRRLCEITTREEAIPTGIIQVPPRRADEGPPPFCAMEGFEVDLDKLSVGLPAALAERREARRQWLED